MDFNMLNNLDDNEQPSKQINKKKLLICIGIIITLILIIIFSILYNKNTNVRNFFDTYIFRKDVYENNLDKIELTEDDSNFVYAFEKNIIILNKNILNIYNSSGKKEHSLNVEISNPIFSSNNKYLAIAENKGEKIYLISDNNIIWQQNIEGSITNITVNKNGYVAVVISDTSYKTVVSMYDSSGNYLFSMYLSSTYAIDISISDDNKYLAIAEANFSGTLIQSQILVISVDDHSKTYYKADSNKLITNIQYQEKNKLVCMYDNSVSIIDNGNVKEFINYDYKTTIFLDINLNSYVAQIEKVSNGLFNSNSIIKFTNINTNNSNTYDIEGIPKSVHSYKDVTAINLGSEALFIKTSGWLLKRYNSNQEIQNIVLSNNIAGIVYKDKVEIIKF